jgi:hypothetical protein
MIIQSELLDLTNLIHRWQSCLQGWNVWNQVLSTKNEDDAWEIRSELVESLVHECLLRPSSIRDAFICIATNSIHQIKLTIDSNYKDKFESDPEHPKQFKFFSRAKKEKQLERIAIQWPKSQELISEIKKLDGIEYRAQTYNYRNLSSHSIEPRLEQGFTRTIIRSVEQATELVLSPNGFYVVSEIPNKMAVSYKFGGIPPLKLTDSFEHNLHEFYIARNCYEMYIELLKQALLDV